MNLQKKIKNAYITGHKGFLGTELKKHLKSYNLKNISRNYNFNQIKKNFNANNYLFHLAAYYNPNPNSLLELSRVFKDNFIFGIDFLSNFEKNYFTKILSTHSYMEYSKNKNTYALAKSLQSEYLTNYFKSKLIKIYIFDTFGLGDTRKKLIQIWLDRLIKNKNIEVFSEKTTINLSSKFYIAKILSQIDKIKKGNYEIRSDVELTLGDLSLHLKQLVGSKSKIIIRSKSKKKLQSKHDDLGKRLKLNYKIDDFNNDILEIINRYN